MESIAPFSKFPATRSRGMLLDFDVGTMAVNANAWWEHI